MLELRINDFDSPTLLQVYDTGDKRNIPLAGTTATQLRSFLGGSPLTPRFEELFDQFDDCELRKKLFVLQLHA